MTLFGLGVDAETPLGPRRRGKRRRHLPAQHHPDEVGIRATLDLDHVGSVLGQHPADLYPHAAMAEVGDPHTGQRQGRFGDSLRCRRPSEQPVRLRARSRVQGCRSLRLRQHLGGEGGQHLVGVLTEVRRAPGGTDPLTVDLHPSRRQAHGPPGGQRHPVESVAGFEMLVGDHVARPEDGGGNDAAALGLLGHLLHGHGGEQLLVERVEHRVGDHEPANEPVILGILQVFGLAQPGPDGVPLARTEHHQSHEPVGRGEDRVHRPGPGP